MRPSEVTRIVRNELARNKKKREKREKRFPSRKLPDKVYNRQGRLVAITSNAPRVARVKNNGMPQRHSGFSRETWQPANKFGPLPREQMRYEVTFRMKT